MKESGLTDTSVIALYIFYNLIFAVLAYPIGLIADRIGLKKIFFIGLLLFVFVYIGFAFFNNIIAFICLLTLYGIYAAATDGIGKAWISNMVPTTETASAIGTFTGMQSIAALFASSICGILWYQFGSMTSFLSTAIISIVVLFYLSRIKHSTADFH